MKSRFRLNKLAVHCMALLGGALSLSAVAEDMVAFEHESAGLEFTLITGDKVSAVVKTDGSLAGIRMVGKDGQDVMTSIFKRGNDTYVIPESAQQFIDNKVIDKELFNISKLYQSGYDDASTDKLPVIVEYPDGALEGSATPAELAGMSLTGEIEIIDSAAFGISKDQAAEVFSALTSDVRIEGVWLDAMVFGHKQNVAETLVPTVPFTGALGSNAINYSGAGVRVAVLDTGYDIEHADLMGRVVASADFSYSSNGVDDLNGHGTHTASTIAGTGKESGGKWAGMAPGAELLVGKVLSNSGGGSTYGILNGMIWAANNGADIVNMSLGGSATSCEGPMVDMVEALREQTLFVISAGNSFTRQTVGSPGCAPSALTVAALDRDNQTASFSSRGPSPDGHSAKPDIGSQGVNVVAAASGGNGATAYRALSGTSMSAPHVAGGAALVLEARPELTPMQLKKVLTSSVVENDAHVLEQGAGPMDVNRAMVQKVIAQPNIELDSFPYAGNTDVTNTFVTFENLSDEDVTYDLSLELMGEDGITRMPATIAGLGVKSITVPANGTAEVPVWIDPTVGLRSGAYGAITGRIEGRSKGQADEQITVPVSFWIQPPQVSLSLSATDLRGMPATSPSKIYLINEEDDYGRYVSMNSGQAEVKVDEGNYTIVAHIMTYDNDVRTSGLVESATQMAYLNKKISSNESIHFDAQIAPKLEFKTDKPIETQGFSFGFTYALDDNKLAKLAAIELAPDYVDNLYLWSQGHDDRFRAFASTHATAPETVMTMQNGVELDLVAQGLAIGFDGEGSAEVVPVGDASYSTDWSQFDLAGKIALVQNPFYIVNYMVNNAIKQGAIGVLYYRPGAHGRYKTSLTGIPRLPVMGLSSEQGEVLFEQINQGNNIVSWKGTSVEKTPYTYDLHHITDGSINGGQVRVHDKELHQFTSSYYSQNNDERPTFKDVMAQTNSTGEFYSTGSPHMLLAPLVREEYYTATPKNTWTNIVMPHPDISTNGAYFDGPRFMTSGAESANSWFKGPRGASLSTSGRPIAYRDTNVLSMTLPVYGDSDGHDGLAGRNSRSAYMLTLNGESTYLSSGTLTVPNETAEVGIELLSYARGVGERSPIYDNLGSLSHVLYNFTTDETLQGTQKVLVPVIDLPVDMQNTMTAGVPAMIKLSGVMDGIDSVDLSEVSLQYGYGQECGVSYISAYIYCPVSAKFTEEAWVDAEVKQVDGEWVAIVPNAAAAGEFVHLRVNMTDEGSSSAQVTTMRAYVLN
ncbi:S8 family serine peptidase [Shewanella sp. Isolate11]|uniref:S8 family serine peptidase n=1 Tax=Shewanella sp. Isolate11 TaxID=2908530 RepID=UPI001EFE2117|nr:S8 family serine peptidase [Shewanella sp. Isolate11]MCG9696906.1 S8 family serine peptidase [Shewanella sp. Isolate11]